MSNLEQDLQNRFGDEQLPNDGFETNELWDAIASDLEPEVAPPFWMKNIKTLGLLLTLVAIAGICYVYNQEDTTALSTSKQAITSITHPYTSDNTPQTDESIAQQATTLASPVHAQTNTQLEELLTATSSQESSSTSTQQSYLNTTLEIKDQPNTRTVKTSEPTFATPRVFKEYSSIQEKSNLLEQKENRIASSVMPNVETEDVFPPVLTETTDIRATLNSIDLLPRFTSESNLPAMDLSLSDESAPIKKKVKSIKGIINLRTGVNALAISYKSSENPELASLKTKTEQVFFGQSYSLSAGALFKDQWSVTAGLEYNNLWSKFEHQNITTGTTLKTDQLLKVLMSSSTGDTLQEIRGDTLVGYRKTRNIQHFNQYKIFTIPIDIGIEKQHNNFLYGITIGTFLNIGGTASGKVIDYQENVYAFDVNDEPSPYYNTKSSLRLTPMIGLALGDKGSVRITPQWTWIRSSPIPGLTANIHQYNVNIGVSLKLD